MKKIIIIISILVLCPQPINGLNLETSGFSGSSAEESFMSCSDEESAKDEETEGNGANIKQNEGG